MLAEPHVHDGIVREGEPTKGGECIGAAQRLRKVIELALMLYTRSDTFVKRANSPLFWRKGRDGRYGRPTILTIVVVWLSVSSACIHMANTGMRPPGQATFQGEVYGDLDVDGTVVSRDTSNNSTVHISNTDGGRRTGAIHATLTNVSEVVVYRYVSGDWDAPIVNTTYSVLSGTIQIEIGTGELAGGIFDANITYRISEFRGEGLGTVLGSDEDYETTQVIARASGTAVLHPSKSLYLIDATLRFDGRTVNVTCGGVILPADARVVLSLDASGELNGGWGDCGHTMYDVQVDGEVRIRDFTEVAGEEKSRYELLVVRGSGVTIRTLASPSTNSHWGTWLDPPWTIIVQTDDPDGVRISQPVSEGVTLVIVWVLTVLVLMVILLRKHTRMAWERILKREFSYPGPSPENIPYEWRMPYKLDPTRSGSAVMGGWVCILNSLACLALTGIWMVGNSRLDGLCVVLGVINPLIGMVGGTFAVMRYRYDLAVLGALFTMASPGFIPAAIICVPVPFAGILALSLIIRGRRSFRMLPSLKNTGDDAQETGQFPS